MQPAMDHSPGNCHTVTVSSFPMERVEIAETIHPGPAANSDASFPPFKSPHDIMTLISRGKTREGNTAAISNPVPVSLAKKLEELLLQLGHDEDGFLSVAIPLMTTGKVRVDLGDEFERIQLTPSDTMGSAQAEKFLKNYLLQCNPQPAAPHVPGEEMVQDGSAESMLREPMKASYLARETQPILLHDAALMRAAMEGRTSTIRILLREGTNVNTRLIDNWTPLMFATWNNHVNTVRTLVESGADLEAKATNGWTPLMIAVWNEHFEISKILVARGANINAKDADDKTVLMWSVHRGSLPIVQLLLEKQVLLNPSNPKGITALGYAVREGHQKIADLLRNFGAR